MTKGSQLARHTEKGNVSLFLSKYLITINSQLNIDEIKSLKILNNLVRKFKFYNNYLII